MDYFISWCLVCEKNIPSDCIYCSNHCMIRDFCSADIERPSYSDKFIDLGLGGFERIYFDNLEFECFLFRQKSTKCRKYIRIS